MYGSKGKMNPELESISFQIRAITELGFIKILQEGKTGEEVRTAYANIYLRIRYLDLASKLLNTRLPE